ncbi:MAG: glycosyltransferase [Chitinophagales bacterium]|nr:glycosyltransferase [Chitinophagales bacterium]
MDFSILIPVYNTHIECLCDELCKQAAKYSDNFQILFVDDCSELSISYINQKVSSYTNVDYQVLSQNIGRSAIRNLLFEKAHYDKCIIMDGDVRIIRDDFLSNYLKALKEDEILVGGHNYQKDVPLDQLKLLHWVYGVKVESKNFEKRQAFPYRSFMTSNFACTKQTFQQLKFDESIHGYGHEDTLFGIHAKQKGIPIYHLDNPIQHVGLENTTVFIDKQKSAVSNLKRLYNSSPNKNELHQQIQLIRLGELRLPWFLLRIIRPLLLKNLKGESPKIVSLQLLKILWWRYG